jgi:hypothetical protein
VLERPDGRVALVVGDVAGHGLRAAASMGQLRNAFRAYGMVEASPAEVVARINRLVMSGVDQVMATVLYLVLDRETGEVAWSAAGHPPPLVIAPDGARFLEGGRSVPIGAADPAVFREATAILPPGSSLLLYTDGLVERRDEPLEERLNELAEAAAAAGDELGELCEHVIAAMLGDADPGDDVALLAVRPVPVAETEISLTLPAEPGLPRTAPAAAGSLPARDRRDRARAVRDHAHDLRGGRQRDRARLRAGRRRPTRSDGPLRGGRAHRDGARHRQLA